MNPDRSSPQRLAVHRFRKRRGAVVGLVFLPETFRRNIDQ